VTHSPNDINNVFLHGDIEEHAYMNQPPSFSSLNPKHVCKLNNTIYRLKQGPRSSFHKLIQTLIIMGFTSMKSLFIKFDNVSIVFILIYIDDIILTSISSHEISSIISLLNFS